MRHELVLNRGNSTTHSARLEPGKALRKDWEERPCALQRSRFRYRQIFVGRYVSRCLQWEWPSRPQRILLTARLKDQTRSLTLPARKIVDQSEQRGVRPPRRRKRGDTAAGVVWVGSFDQSRECPPFSSAAGLTRLGEFFTASYASDSDTTIFIIISVTGGSGANWSIHQRVTNTGYWGMLPSTYLARRRVWTSSMRR